MYVFVSPWLKLKTVKRNIEVIAGTFLENS